MSAQTRMVSAMKIFYGLVLMGLAAGAVNAQLRFDLRDTAQPFGGFGTQIRPGDLSVESVIRDLNIQVVRMDIGKFKKKIDIEGWEDAEYDEYYARYKWTHHLKTAQMLKKYDVKIIINAFRALDAWTADAPRKHTLSPEFYAHYVKRIAAALASMKAKGIDLIGVEPFNEPDGDRDCYVAPAACNQLVVMLRAELDQRNLEEVMILGPGLAHIDTSPREPWITSLTTPGARAIGAWSAHGYHWDSAGSQDPVVCRPQC